VSTGLVDHNGNPISKEKIRDPQEVAERVRKRNLRTYEETSKKLLNYAMFGVSKRWPVNITDDLKYAALLLAEVYIAKREGIIKDA
jgi:hypothetical protein